MQLLNYHQKRFLKLESDLVIKLTRFIFQTCWQLEVKLFYVNIKIQKITSKYRKYSKLPNCIYKDQFSIKKNVGNLAFKQTILAMQCSGLCSCREYLNVLLTFWEIPLFLQYLLYTNLYAS